jgi:hypothetical protein
VSDNWDIGHQRWRILLVVVSGAWGIMAFGANCLGQTNSAPAAPYRANLSHNVQLAQGQNYMFPAPDLGMQNLPFKTQNVNARSPQRGSPLSSQKSSDVESAHTSLFRRIEREGGLGIPADKRITGAMGRVQVMQPEVVFDQSQINILRTFLR